VRIPLNTQISFKNSLSVTVQLIEQTIQSIELTVSLTQAKVSVVTEITVF